MTKTTMLNSTQKALEINLNDKIYGTFAEIGAGQEVARYFFRAGGAAGTIAKSMSAYDMTISDVIYGKSGRYVSLQRLRTMLFREYEQLCERLVEGRGHDTSFFVFADTVAAKSFRGTGDCHGWMGVRFQHKPMAGPSQVVIHVRMKDHANLQQQEALGVVGVNLLYACYNYPHDRSLFIESLMEHLSAERMEIDTIEVSGPAFQGVDSRLWSLELVNQEFCHAIFFDEKGQPDQAKDALYRKNIVISRGSYRPPTLVNMDMLEKGTAQFKLSLPAEEQDNILVLPEISMNKLKQRSGVVDSEDFLARVDLLALLGKPVLISNYETYGQLGSYLTECTKEKIAFVMGFYNLNEIFKEEHYSEHGGGALGGIGDLIGHRTRLLCYPAQNDKGEILRAMDVELAPKMKDILEVLIKHKNVEDIEQFNQDVFHIWSRVVLGMIEKGEEGWEDMIPKNIGEEVKKRCLFGFPCKVGP